ncbi:MAG: hypothetical protein GXO18_08320 [Aquificae bacterium]|nr:hypothetical protein [Aquificota bacterium]
MGIFKEDLINFGNLIDTEVEVKLSPRDFSRVFENLEFEFSDRLMKIRGEKKVLFLKKRFELRLGQDEQKVYNVREFKTEDMGIYLKIMSKDGLEEVLKREGISREGEYLKMSVFEVLKRSKIYGDIPDAFKERLVLNRYKIGNGYLSIYITVTK